MSKIPGTVPQLSAINRSNRDAVLSGSHYYWWFMFLRKNEGYRRYCDDGRDQSFADLYADFGDVHRCSFEEWWEQRGYSLFAPPKPSEVIVRIPDQGMASRDLYEYPMLVVAFDCTRGEAAIRKSFSEYMKMHLQKRVGRPKKEKLHVDAKYKMTGRPHVETLENMYLVLMAIDDCHAKGEAVNYANIGNAQRIKVNRVQRRGGQHGDRRRLLAEKVRKLYLDAQLAVEATGDGYFPRVPRSDERRQLNHRDAWEIDRDRARREFEQSLRQAR